MASWPWDEDDYLANSGRPRRMLTNRWVAWVGRTRDYQGNGQPEPMTDAGDLAERLARMTAAANRSRAQRERRRREREQAEAELLAVPVKHPELVRTPTGETRRGAGGRFVQHQRPSGLLVVERQPGG